MKDSQIAPLQGAGRVGQRKIPRLPDNFGKLPEKERAKAMQDMIRGMPAEYRDVIETYMKKIAAGQSPGK